MGYVHAEIQLKNPRLSRLKPMRVKAMVDTGALTLCIPQHVAVQLKLETNSQREVTTADGRKQMDLIISPARRKLVVNPDSPNFPHALVKYTHQGRKL